MQAMDPVPIHLYTRCYFISCQCVRTKLKDQNKQKKTKTTHNQTLTKNKNKLHDSQTINSHLLQSNYHTLNSDITVVDVVHHITKPLNHSRIFIYIKSNLIVSWHQRLLICVLICLVHYACSWRRQFARCRKILRWLIKIRKKNETSHKSKRSNEDVLRNAT